MTTKEMRDYLIDIIRTDGICDGAGYYFTEEEISRMSPYGVKQLYDLCFPNFGERNPPASPAGIWEF